MFKLIKTIFLLTTITSYSNVIAQPYESIVDTTKVWNVLESVWKPYPNDDKLDYQQTVSYRFRDTCIINDKTYYYLETCINDSLFQNWTKTFYFFREDNNGNVYFIRETSKEQLIYNLDLEKGDILENDNLLFSEVDSTKQEYLGNKVRKVIYLWTYITGQIKIIEGIGTLTGPISPVYWGLVGKNYFYDLLCVYQNDKLLFQYADKCFIPKKNYNTSSKLISLADKCIIYNNNEKIITVSILEDWINPIIEIYTCHGNLVSTKFVNSKSIKITTKDLNNGIYLVLIKSNNKIIKYQKLIIN